MSVTEGDRRRANELMRIPLNAQDWTQCRDLVAQALADEREGARERARARFRALLDLSPQLTNEDGTLRGYLVSLPLLSTIGLDGSVTDDEHTKKCDPECGCDETCTTPLPSELDEYGVTDQ